MSTDRQAQLLRSVEFRRAYEEELLFGEATETVTALLSDLKITQADLAKRLGVTASRVSQMLSGDDNLTLRSLAGIGWALGIRFALEPVPMTDRAGTPAVDDPRPPKWLEEMRRKPTTVFVNVKRPNKYRTVTRDDQRQSLAAMHNERDGLGVAA